MLDPLLPPALTVSFLNSDRRCFLVGKRVIDSSPQFSLLGHPRRLCPRLRVACGQSHVRECAATYPSLWCVGIGGVERCGAAGMATQPRRPSAGEAWGGIKLGGRSRGVCFYPCQVWPAALARTRREARPPPIPGRPLSPQCLHPFVPSTSPARPNSPPTYLPPVPHTIALGDLPRPQIKPAVYRMRHSVYSWSYIRK